MISSIRSWSCSQFLGHPSRISLIASFVVIMLKKFSATFKSGEFAESAPCGNWQKHFFFCSKIGCWRVWACLCFEARTWKVLWPTTMQCLLLDIDLFYALRFHSQNIYPRWEKYFARSRADIENLHFFAEMTLKTSTKNKKNARPPPAIAGKKVLFQKRVENVSFIRFPPRDEHFKNCNLTNCHLVPLILVAWSVTLYLVDSKVETKCIFRSSKVSRILCLNILAQPCMSFHTYSMKKNSPISNFDQNFHLLACTVRTLRKTSALGRRWGLFFVVVIFFIKQSGVQDVEKTLSVSEITPELAQFNPWEFCAIEVRKHLMLLALELERRKDCKRGLPWAETPWFHCNFKMVKSSCEVLAMQRLLVENWSFHRTKVNGEKLLLFFWKKVEVACYLLGMQSYLLKSEVLLEPN